ncbi:hypothetical protein D3C80_1536240 [compost metagenome]
MAQRTAQGVDIELVTHQPVADGAGRHLGLVVQQQNSWQLAAPRHRLQGRSCQHHGLAIMAEQAIDRVPVRRGQQHGTAVKGRHAGVQQGGPLRLISQQQQTQRFDRRGQAGSLGLGRGSGRGQVCYCINENDFHF